MALSHLGARLVEGTRGRIVALLRRGARTVEELAHSVELTDNAVRSQLTSLERDGLVRQEGSRRGQGAGKPATLYALHPDADELFSAAYPPVLGALLDALADTLPPEQLSELLQTTGRALASDLGGPARGSREDRARAAAEVLRALGGEVELVTEGKGPTIRGYGCPLSAVVSRRPEACRAVEALVSAVAGLPARECCDRGERPRCCFRLGAARAPAQAR